MSLTRNSYFLYIFFPSLSFLFQSNNMALQTALRHFNKTFLRDVSKDHVPSPTSRPHIITSNLEHDSIKLVLKAMVDDGLAGSCAHPIM